VHITAASASAEHTALSKLAEKSTVRQAHTEV